MPGTACTGDDDFQPSRLCTRGVVVESFRGAVCRDDAHIAFHAQLLELPARNALHRGDRVGADALVGLGVPGLQAGIADAHAARAETGLAGDDVALVGAEGDEQDRGLGAGDAAAGAGASGAEAFCSGSGVGAGAPLPMSSYSCQYGPIASATASGPFQRSRPVSARSAS